MHTILGANGQIATELARALHRTHGSALRLVSRNPRPVHPSDTLVRADLLDADQTLDAVRGSRVVYFTAGLPLDTRLWETQFPRMLQHALQAARQTGAAFVYFDNTYMYPQDDRLQTGATPFAPRGRKGRVRAAMATQVLAEMARGEIPVLIARAPEFYGPGLTQSYTQALIITPLLQGKTARVPVRDDTLRTLIWTPDASRALALLGHTPMAYGQTWHLPCCDERLTYRDFITLAARLQGTAPRYRVLGRTLLRALALCSKPLREFTELLPRYQTDNLFDSGKFKQAFPEFAVTTYAEGLRQIVLERNGSA